jgi:hypothetical protein
MRTAVIVVGLLAAACGPKMDARSAYNASRLIVETAQAGKAAAAQCKQGGNAAATFCPKVDDAFNNIADAAKGINQNADQAGGSQ